MARAGYLVAPEGCARAPLRTAGPFVVEEAFFRPDGREVVWRSRRHRKGADLVTRRLQARLRRREHALLAPHRLGWWIGVLFMVGSACFAVASLLVVVDAIGGHESAVVSFAGSIFFTSAAYLQLLQVVNVERELELEPGAVHSRLRPFAVETRRIDWWACAVQLVGTLLFNASTFAATLQGLGWRSAELSVWIPDAAGSVCFLVASYLAIVEVGWRPRLRATEWWITQVNWGGSIAFGVSAVAAVVLPGSGQELDPGGAAAWTLLGALCFLVGGSLLLPEAAEAERPRPTSAGAAAGVSA